MCERIWTLPRLKINYFFQTNRSRARPTGAVMLRGKTEALLAAQQRRSPQSRPLLDMRLLQSGAIGTMRTVAVGATGTTAIVVVGAVAAIAATGTTMLTAAVFRLLK